MPNKSNTRPIIPSPPRDSKRPNSARQSQMKSFDPQALDALWRDALQGNPSALSELVALCKAKAVREALLEKPNQAQLRENLHAQAPKTRKNTARLLGALSQYRDIPVLIETLECEETLFVLPSLILALGLCGSHPQAPITETDRACQAIEDCVSAVETDCQSHKDAILQAASTAFSRLKTQEPHACSGLPPLALCLTAPGNCGALLEREAREKGLTGYKRHGNTVWIDKTDYQSIFTLRCFEEALVPIGQCSAPPDNAKDEQLIQRWSKETAAAARDFTRLLQEHYTPLPIPYRIELRGVAHTMRAPIAHALATELDQNGLRNDPSHYIAELRLEVQSEDLRSEELRDKPHHASRHSKGQCRLFAKLFLPKDPRFDYRRGALPASIHPVTAANLMRFALPHLKERARVFDPCCGSATLLLERAKLRKPVQALGIDISTHAVAIARQNSRTAIEQDTSLTLKLDILGGDLRTFRPKQPFDEVIANLPFGTRVGTKESNDALYRALMQRLHEFLLPDGIAVLYCTQRTVLLRLAAQYGYTLIDEMRFDAGGLQPWGLVFKRA